MNEKMNQKNEQKKTEQKKTDKIVIIGTNELSEILSDKIGRTIETKYIRNKFRNDLYFDELSKIDDRSKYRFPYPSKLIDGIIQRFIEIETERKNRKLKSVERKTNKRKTDNSYYDKIDGKMIKITVK